MFTHVATFVGGVPHLDGVTSLEVHWLGGQAMLYSGSEANGGLAAFSLSAGGACPSSDDLGGRRP